MAILMETKPKFAIRQVAQGAPYFDILETQGLAKGFWDIEMGKGWLNCGKRDRGSETAVWTKQT